MGVRRTADLEGGHGKSKVVGLVVNRSGCLNAKISHEQSVAAGEVEASVGVHGAVPMPMGMERNIRCE